MRYEEYKDSGVAWIGEIPSHWEVAAFKRRISINNGRDYKEFQDDEIYPVMGSGGCFAYCSKYMYDGEALLLGRKGTIDKPLYINGKFWTVDTMFYAIPNKDLDCKFAYYLAITFPFNLYSTSTALPSMTQTDLGNNPVAFPPLVEQQAIASYLDKKCGKINGAIDVQKKKIDLLNELKQSIITEVVTKGLKPDAPMKDSGVEWIGKIPTQWKRSRLKFLFSHSNAGVWGEEEKGDENDIACFRVADFDYQKGYLGFDKLTMRNITAKELDGRLLTEGSLLIEKSGGGDATPVGRVVRFNYEDKATCSNFVHFVTVDESHNSDFLYYYFYAMYANKENLLYFNQTTGIQNLKVGEYLGQTIFIPTYEEQQAIASYLDEKYGKINDAIDVQKKKIDLLNELKQSIITEAVTGKIKVC